MANWMENTTQMRFSYRLLPIKWLTWVHSYFFTIKIFWSKYLAWKFMLNLPIYLCSLGAMLFVLNSCMGFSDLSFSSKRERLAFCLLRYTLICLNKLVHCLIVYLYYLFHLYPMQSISDKWKKRKKIYTR